MYGDILRVVGAVLTPEEGGKSRLTRYGDVTTYGHSKPQGGAGPYLSEGVVFIGLTLDLIVEALPPHAKLGTDANAQPHAVPQHGPYSHHGRQPHGPSISTETIGGDGQVAGHESCFERVLQRTQVGETQGRADGRRLSAARGHFDADGFLDL